MASIDELRKVFQKMIKEGRLAHGYILFGHESARERLALAKELAGDTADVLFLDARLDAGIGIIRDARQFLWQKPAVSPRRALVIDNADRMTAPAQNAILKIAEEPPARALMILMVRDPGVLLPALVSRFQKIFVAGAGAKAGAEEARKFLGASPAKRKELLKNLLDEIKEEENDQKLEEFVAGILAELGKDKVKNHKIIKELLARWALIRQFNVNKKLQLEAALGEL